MNINNSKENVGTHMNEMLENQVINACVKNYQNNEKYYSNKVRLINNQRGTRKLALLMLIVIIPFLTFKLHRSYEFKIALTFMNIVSILTLMLIIPRYLKKYFSNETKHTFVDFEKFLLEKQIKNIKKQKYAELVGWDEHKLIVKRKNKRAHVAKVKVNNVYYDDSKVYVFFQEFPVVVVNDIVNINNFSLFCNIYDCQYFTSEGLDLWDDLKITRKERVFRQIYNIFLTVLLSVLYYTIAIIAVAVFISQKIG